MAVLLFSYILRRFTTARYNKSIISIPKPGTRVSMRNFKVNFRNIEKKLFTNARIYKLVKTTKLL